MRAKPNATYKIMFKNGWLTSKIVIKDITESQDYLDEPPTEKSPKTE